MKYWLVKSEPGTYSWDDLCRDRRTHWDGVRNFQARNNLRAMRPKDLALFYHSVNERNVVGVARVVSEPYPDPSAKGGDWTVVDLQPAYPLAKPVNLEDVKSDTSLSEMILLRQSRLSVQPVQKSEFDRIVKMGGRGRP